MYCGKCGSKIPDECEYCMNCGTKIESDTRTDSLPIKKRNKTILILALMAIILMVAGVFFFKQNAGRITVPKILNSETKEVLSDESETVLNNSVQELVKAFNDRNSGDTGLLNHTDSFDNAFSSLKSRCNTVSGDEAEILKEVEARIFVIESKEITEVNSYDSNYQKLDKPIVPDGLLKETKKSIQEIIDKYYK